MRRVVESVRASEASVRAERRVERCNSNERSDELKDAIRTSDELKEDRVGID
jgi:hypothetical protein